MSNLPIDYSLEYPNIMGKPLFMLPNPLTDEQVEALGSLHERGRAKRYLADYARYALEVTPALHHRIICQAIDELLADEYDELIVCTPPGAAKSTYTSHALGSYFMGIHPEKNIILATHTAELSERFSRKVRNTIATAEHARVFPESQLSKDSTAVGRWATTAGGEFLAAGVGASILGFRSDLAIIDDPISGFEQAQSDTQLQKIHGWYETDFVTRLKPEGKTVLICQRLSMNDMAGYLIARNALNPTKRQRLLILRMEAEEGDNDGTGRQPGERLWAEWFTQEQVEDAKRDNYKWRTLYQQRPPSEEGSWVSEEHIKVVDIVPSAVTPYMLTDLALSVNKGDYSVHIIVGLDNTGQLFIIHAWRDRCSPERTVERHLDLVEEYKPMESLIDDDNASKVYVQLLASRGRERGVPVPFHKMPMRGQDKETRAAPLRGLFRSGKVSMKRAPWNEWLVRELLSFPNALGSGVDDGVDALGLIGRRLMSLARPAPDKVASPPAPTTANMTLEGLHEERQRGHSLSRRRL